MHQEIKNWWDQSKSDLEKAEILHKNKKYDGTAFYCQQAAEKGLKALYLKQFKELRRVHDLVFLGRKLQLPDNLLEKCFRLNKVYTETRYPDASGEIPAHKFSQADAESFVRITKDILQWLHTKLSGN